MFKTAKPTSLYFLITIIRVRKGAEIKNAGKTILLSRFLTRMGDQAWDFALPLTLLALFPAKAGFVITLFLGSKLGIILILPWLANIIDSWPRLQTILFGTTLQFLGVLLVSFFVLTFAFNHHNNDSIPMVSNSLFFGFVMIGSVASSLGSHVMDIALGNDWIPAIISADKLAQVNSRLRQLDLFTEVSAPLVAGTLLLLQHPAIPMVGFFIVAIWNSLSFIPEAFLLRSVIQKNDILQKRSDLNPQSRSSLWRNLFDGWHLFKNQKSAPAMVAYALLWLSALSPHGVLLTAFLKSDWKISELSLGIFRGSGALFGLSATFLFPLVHKKFGLLKSSAFFLCFQAAVVVASLPFFYTKILNGWAFLFFVLLSRIGLYGFSLGELEIRQKYIKGNYKGKINGVASALNSCATLVLFSFGALFPTSQGFASLVTISCLSVVLACLIFWNWFASLPPDFT